MRLRDEREAADGGARQRPRQTGSMQVTPPGAHGGEEEERHRHVRRSQRPVGEEGRTEDE